jgi:hypothetical protein
MQTQRRQTAILLLAILILILAIWLVYYFFLRSPGVIRVGAAPSTPLARGPIALQRLG